MHVPADDLLGVRILDQTQADELAVCGKVGDVCYLELFAGANLLWPGFEQVGVAREAMVAVGRLVVHRRGASRSLALCRTSKIASRPRATPGSCSR